MDTETTKRIIEVEVDQTKAIAQLVEYGNNIKEITAEEKNLQDQLKKGQITQEEYNKKMAAANEVKKEYSRIIRETSKEIQNSLKQDKEKADSLKSLRAELSNATKRYDEMSKAERDSAQGMELLKHIKEVTANIKTVEEATDRYYRNVGNYKNALIETGAAFKQAGVSTGAFDMSLKALNANPWVALLMAAVTVIKQVIAAFKGNEEATMALKQAFSALNPIIDFMKRGLESFANTVVNVVTKSVSGLTSALQWLLDKAQAIGNYFGADWHMGDNFRAASEAAKELQEAENNYILAKRKFGVESAKIDRDVADLRAKAADKEKYTAKERAKFLDEAIALETKKIQMEKDLAQMNLDNLKKEAERSANDAAMNDKLAEAERAVIEADTKLAETKRSLNKERQSAIEQGKKEIDTAKKYADLVATEMAKAEKALISLIEDGAQKRIALENNSYEESKAKLQSSLDYARKKYGEQSELYKAYASQLESLEKTHAKALEDIERTNSAEALRIRQDEIARQLTLVQKGTAEEFDLRRKLLEKKKEELLLNDKLTAEQRLLIEKQYQQDLVKLGEEEVKARQDKARKLLENRIAEMQLSYQQTGELELQLLQQNIDNLAQLQGESDEDFYARRLAAQKAYNDKKKALDAAEMAMEKTKANYMASIAGSISSLMEEVSDDNKAMVKASKIVALAEVAIKQGVAIAEAVASAAAGDPYTYALRVAAAIASTVAAMAQAISSINSVKLARGTAFVKGPGTSTSDSVPAMLSVGEGVVNAKGNAMFPGVVQAMNDAGNGIYSPVLSMLRNSGGAPVQVSGQQEAISRMAMASAMREAMEDLDLYVSVEEINRKEKRVKAVEQLATV